VRVLLDGVGSDALAELLVAALAPRPVARVRAGDFLRPAGERFAHGREDAEALRTTWLDAAALQREVLGPALRGRYLPALRDAERDRSVRRPPEPLSAGAVLVVDGLFLLDRGLPAELSVHVALSPAALRRRGVPAWQLPAFADHAGPAQACCDVLVLAEDPRRPAVVLPEPGC